MAELEADDALWEDNYKKLGPMPFLWQSVARDLICAANVLYKRVKSLDRRRRPLRGRKTIRPERFHTSMAIVMMLYALAVENLVKAVLVAKGINATASGKLDPRLKSHHLSRLFEHAGLAPSSQDRWFLDQLQRAIESGKYPVGTRPPRSFRHEKHGLVLPRDVDHAFGLIETLESTLRRLEPDNTLRTIRLRSLCARR